MKNLAANVIRAGVVVALLSLAPLSSASGRGGGTRLLEMPGRPIVAPAPSATMNCSGCKDGTATVVRANSSRGASIRKTTVTRHLCKECTTRFEVKGHGKAKERVPVHACPTCKS
jgi:hypothetical protein